MLAAVTGATGLVGANLVRMLLDRGVKVRALTYGPTRALDGLDIECMPCDVLDMEGVREGVSGADVVYHVAAVITLTDGADPMAERVNEEGARNVALACLDAKVGRMAYFSSIHVLSPYPVEEPVSEDRPLCTGDDQYVYDRSKARGQQAVLDAVARGLDAVIVHPTGILGPNDFEPSATGRQLIDWAYGRGAILLDAGFDFVDARDVCAGTIAAVEHGRAGENYILSGNYLTLKELAEMAGLVAGCRKSKVALPLWVGDIAAPLMGMVQRFGGAPSKLTRFTMHTLRHHQVVSSAKASEELGYVARPMAETLRDTFAWFSEMGMLKGLSLAGAMDPV